MEQYRTLTPDSKGRVTIGKAAKNVDAYRMSEENGKIILEPMALIPERERWLYENPEALKSVLRGIEQAKRGEGKYLGSFSEYADIEID